MSDLAHHYEDEIELIDILRVLWTWKMLIISGTLVFGIIAFAVTLNIPKTFKVDMILQPGVLNTDETGQKIYLDSAQSIAGRVRAGIYNDKVSAYVSKVHGEKPQTIGFKVEIPKQVNVVQVSYDTADPKRGAAMLNYLFSLLSKEDKKLYLSHVENYNHQISLKNIEIQKKKELEKSYLLNVNHIDQRIKEISDEIEVMNKNSVSLGHERKKLLERKTDEAGTVSVLLYSNAIQQNIMSVSMIKRDLNEHLRMKETGNQKIIRGKNERKILSEEIFSLEKQRDSIQTLTLVKSPIVSNQPTKPNKRLIVLLALIAGMFFMVFLSFFIEYIRNNRISS